MTHYPNFRQNTIRCQWHSPKTPHTFLGLYHFSLSTNWPALVNLFEHIFQRSQFAVACSFSCRSQFYQFCSWNNGVGVVRFALNSTSNASHAENDCFGFEKRKMQSEWFYSPRKNYAYKYRYVYEQQQSLEQSTSSAILFWERKKPPPLWLSLARLV